MATIVFQAAYCLADGALPGISSKQNLRRYCNPKAMASQARRMKYR